MLLPTPPSTGCTKFSTSISKTAYYWQGPDPAQFGTFDDWLYSSNNRITLITSNSDLSRQCFNVDGDLTTGARIMYKGLCVGYYDMNLPRPGMYSSTIISLRPCNDGWTLWQRTAEGYLKPQQCQLFSDNTCAHALLALKTFATGTSLYLYNTNDNKARALGMLSPTLNNGANGTWNALTYSPGTAEVHTSVAACKALYASIADCIATMLL